MRNKIDYGIDLGTTNSAIARMQNGEPIIIRSDKQKDTMPSCVHFTRSKDIQVGDTAVGSLKNDSVRSLRTGELANNSFVEFKRLMGTGEPRYSKNMGQYFTPEELSAEVLKKLKSFQTEENIASVVITIPAKFLNPQNEATMKAARLAGFKQIYLLQEPVAAATAYSVSSKLKDGFLVVFDFGGGTFDAALLKSEAGILSIKDTEGDNFLGGKNIDEAIVDQLLIPYLHENYSYNNILNDPTKREALRNILKIYAEDAKIQLSYKDTAKIDINLDDLPEDENGIEPSFDFNLRESEVEKILAPIFQKSIDITNSLLRRNNLTGKNIEALILVGGPTYSPIFRRMIKDQITEKMDTSVDPMTVVAKGAALYASTISIADEVKETLRDKTKIQLDIKYEATTIETDEMVNIKLLPDKTEGQVPDKLFIDVVRNPEGFSTGKKQISERATLIELRLEKNRSNEFNIIAYDTIGNKIECQPNRFTILQGIGGVDGMQVLPYHIGIVKHFQTEDKDLYKPVKGLEKNKAIKTGVTGEVDGLKTRMDIRPCNGEDIIRIPIYQGDYFADGTNPDLNFHISDVIISGENFPKLLVAGSPVNIRIKIDASSLMTFIAEFPTIEHEEVAKIEIKEITPLTEQELKNKFSHSMLLAKRVKQTELIKKIENLNNELSTIGKTADGRLRLMNDYRNILIELDQAEKESEWPNLEQELKEVFFTLEELVALIKENEEGVNLKMSLIEAHLEEFRKKIEFVLKEKNTKEAKELITGITQIDFELRNAVTGNAMDTQVLKHINDTFNSYHWKNPAKARQLVNQGLEMVVKGNTLSIRPILIELISLMPEDERPETLG